MTFATPRACAALLALAAIAAAPLPAAAGRHYYLYPADQAATADATIRPEKPFPYERQQPIDTALDAVAVDAPAPQFVTLKQMRIVSGPLSAVHVLPGTYRIRAACESGAYKETLVSEPVAIEAGRDYFVACHGQTRDEARVSVTSQSAAELHGVRGVPPRSFDLPAGTTADQVGESLQRALKGRGWEVTATAPGRVDSTLHIRDHVAVIRVDYTASQATFSYVDSTNLEYSDEDGFATVHRQYYNWINFLGGDLLTYLRGEVPQL
jgi:hypothetical protein